MEKKYANFLDEITADELYEGLLGYGMFANKLPVPFFDYCQANNPHFSDKWQDYIYYSSMRNVNIPRALGIPTKLSGDVNATVPLFPTGFENIFK